MSIQLNANLKIVAPASIDKRYLSERTSGGSPLPYSGTSEVLSIIPSTERYIGLTVLINGTETGSVNTEYWFKDNVSTLIEKKYDTVIPEGDFITGATNIGYFSGYSGIQKLCIVPLSTLGVDYLDFQGDYCSLYNSFYRDDNGCIRVGTSPDGYNRRGYVKNEYPAKSWVWNENIGGSCLKGWLLVNCNIENFLGQYRDGCVYYTSASEVYTGITWSPSCVSSLGKLSIVAVEGSITTGTTLTIGGRVYGCAEHNNLHFRTVISDSPNYLKVTDDDGFIRLSGTTSVITGNNLGTGAHVYAIKTGSTLNFRTLTQSGDTTITQRGNDIVIYSSSNGSATAITGATNIGSVSGVSVYDSTVNRNLLFRKLIGSGNTKVCHVGNDVVITSSGGTGSEYYTYDSPSVCPVGGMCVGTTLTGKTANQILAEILVPTVQPAFVAPSNSIVLSPASGSICEIGYIIPTVSVTSNFNRGSYTPAYCGGTPYGSGLANQHVFFGTGVAGLTGTTASTVIKTTSSYTVLSGAQSWCTNVDYDAGVQALDSKGGASTCPPVAAGTAGLKTATIIGAYPLWASCTTIGTLSKVSPLYNMSTENNIQLTLVPETGGFKQQFEIPCAWLSSRPLIGVCQCNTIASCWEYPGGSQANSLLVWTCSSASETIQGSSIGYCQYTYNGACRAITTYIRLVF